MTFGALWDPPTWYDRSFGWNDEVNLAALDPALAAKLTANFEEDLGKSHRETLQEWENRSFGNGGWNGWLDYCP